MWLTCRRSIITLLSHFVTSATVFNLEHGGVPSTQANVMVHSVVEVKKQSYYYIRS